MFKTKAKNRQFHRNWHAQGQKERIMKERGGRKEKQKKGENQPIEKNAMLGKFLLKKKRELKKK